MLEVVTLVGVQLGRAPAWSPDALTDRHHRFDQRLEDLAVVPVGRREEECQRDAVVVDQKVAI